MYVLCVYNAPKSKSTKTHTYDQPVFSRSFLSSSRVWRLISITPAPWELNERIAACFKRSFVKGTPYFISIFHVELFESMQSETKNNSNFIHYFNLFFEMFIDAQNIF